MSELDERVHVSFNDGERPDRQVVRACNRCYGRGVSVRELPLIEVVSVHGTAHKGGDGTHDGQTDCGIDATGPEWWWRE